MGWNVVVLDAEAPTAALALDLDVAAGAYAFRHWLPPCFEHGAGRRAPRGRY
jgi:hypothetical protein